jgi:3-methyladenine DNA glycosylase AlkD
VSSSPAAVVDQILDGLERNANPNTASMRGLARTVYGGVKSTITSSEAIAVCDRLMRDERIHVKITGLLFLACHAKLLDAEAFTAAQRWIESNLCDSWAVIDALCIDVLGPMLQRRPKLFASTRSWHKSSNLWLRRAVAVVLVKPARRGLLLDEAYFIGDKLRNDAEDRVQKAVGWLLRESGKTDMTRLQAFLEKHGAGFARTSLRYAIERFPEPTRRRLLIGTRGG